MKQSISLDLENFIDFDELENNVIRQLANTCESKLSGGHIESFHGMCITAINDAISGRIEQKINELLSKPIVQCNAFGEPVEGAEEKTFERMLAESVELACQETVDAAGKPARPTAYNKAIPRIQWHLSKIASREIDREAARVMADLNKEAKEKIRHQIAAAVAAQLAK